MAWNMSSMGSSPPMAASEICCSEGGRGILRLPADDFAFFLDEVRDDCVLKHSFSSVVPESISSMSN